ncbi:MAG: hypothetical protein U9Q82_11145 [Chloroflexota bacterium]|nr:hypothetical protein [Chloroflexota bacterium]
MFENTSPLIINESPLQVLPSLATLVGLNEAIAIQQVHYWLRHYQKSEANLSPQKQHHFKQGRWWVYNSYPDWQENNFPFWSESTIKRAFRSLEKQHMLISKKLSDNTRDRTNWYSINYAELNRLYADDAGDEPDPALNVGGEPDSRSKDDAKRNLKSSANDDAEADKTGDPMHQVKMTSWKRSKWTDRSGQVDPMLIRYLTETTQRIEEEVNDGCAIAATAAENLVIHPDLVEVVDIFSNTGRELNQDTLIRFEQMAKRCDETARQKDSTGGQWLTAALTLALGKAQPESVLNYAGVVLDGWVERGYRKRPQPQPPTDEISPELDIFKQATERLPLPDQRGLVISLINEYNFTSSELRRFWEAWITRDKKRSSLIWLTDWAISGKVPKPYQKSAKRRKSTNGISPAVAEYVRDRQDQANGGH